MMLRGYRTSDLELLTGPWLPGELLGLPLRDWPALAAPTTVPPPANAGEELCVVSGMGFVRYTEIDWVHRRARMEIGLRPGPAESLVVLIKSAVSHGFLGLNLHRLYGWVTPATNPPANVLAGAGFQREATVPDAIWLDGRPVERELWGAVRHD